MKRVLVLSLTLLFLLSNFGSAMSAENWWLENRRSGQLEDSDSSSPVDQVEKEQEETEKETETEETSDGNFGTSFINWWLENRRFGQTEDSESSRPVEKDLREKDNDSQQESSQSEEVVDDESSQIRNAEEQHLFNAINEERRERGIEELEYCEQVSEVARKKSQDMIENDYYAHESPTYGSAADMLRAAGISFRVSKENLAQASSASQAHSLLMSSSGHRSGILGERYTHVGIGVCEPPTGNLRITQIFIQR